MEQLQLDLSEGEGEIALDGIAREQVIRLMAGMILSVVAKAEGKEARHDRSGE